MITAITIALTYIGARLIDQLIVDQGYTGLKKLFFQKKKYERRLVSILNRVIDRFESEFPPSHEANKYPFYHSHEIFTALNKYILFDHNGGIIELEEELSKNPKIIKPVDTELTYFYDEFLSEVTGDKHLEKLFINENYKKRIFNIHETVNEILVDVQGIKTEVEGISANLNFEPNPEWFANICKGAIQDLGRRYLPKSHFDLAIQNIFSGIGRTPSLERRLRKLCDALLISGKKIKPHQIAITEVERLRTQLKNVEDWFVKFQDEIQGMGQIEERIIHDVITRIFKYQSKIYDIFLKKEWELQEEAKNYHSYQKYGYDIHVIGEFEENLRDLDEFLTSTAFKLINKPILILDGKGGLGKSHLLGDTIIQRGASGSNSLLFLGQHFTTEEDPWTQIFKRWKIKCDETEFLTALNSYGLKTGKRIVLFIDALNEGKGKYFWPSNIGSFINKFNDYPYVGLVLTLRSEYNDLFLSGLQDSKIIRETTYGFSGIEYEASRVIFESYGIKHPEIPLLHPEFQSPLFLITICEGLTNAGLTKIPKGLHGMSQLMRFIIESTNNKLSGGDQFDYEPTVNLVDKVVSILIQQKLSKGLSYIPYDTASKISSDIVDLHSNKKGFVDALIQEGLLAKNLFAGNNSIEEEGVYLAYERFEDFMTAKILLEKHSDFTSEFKKEGNLYPLVSSLNATYINRGVIEMLAILIPELSGHELFDYVPDLASYRPSVDAFFDSLIWRKTETITTDTDAYVQKLINTQDWSENNFFDSIISHCADPNFFYNGNYIHKWLSKLVLSERDSTWTININSQVNRTSAINRLLEWAWSEKIKQDISSESRKLICTTICWFLTSSNRSLRDKATRSLTTLLVNHLGTAVELHQLFHDIDDLYVHERLWASIYGAALNSKIDSSLQDLSQYTYSRIFNQSEVFPHVMVRDYARGIVEYATSLDLGTDIELNRITPPYQSAFSKDFEKGNFIKDGYHLKYPSDKRDFKILVQNVIVSSMATQHDTYSYGDFGRYVFQSTLNDFQIDVSNLSHYALKLIFEDYGYDPEKFGAYDREVMSQSRNVETQERIGKKYQWMAFHEIFARTSDNFKLLDSWYLENSKEIKYKGSWEHFLRDIDPTMIYKSHRENDQSTSSNGIFDLGFKPIFTVENKEWVMLEDTFPESQVMIEFKDNEGDEWYVMEAYPHWIEPSELGKEKWEYPQKDLWVHTNSFFIQKSDRTRLVDLLNSKSIIGDFMPEAPNIYNCYHKEFYWSPAFNDLLSLDRENKIWDKVNLGKTRGYGVKVAVTSLEYSFTNELDKSQDQRVRFLKPGVLIHESLYLKDDEILGQYANEKGEIVCKTQPLESSDGTCLLIKKEFLEQFLSKNNLDIVWTLVGKKSIMGGMRSGMVNHKQVFFSGAYYLEEGEVKGQRWINDGLD